MPNVTLPARTPVDLYAATPFTVGTVLKVTNIGASDVRLSESEVGLGNDHIPIKPYAQAENEATDTGAWASSVVIGAVNVVEG